MTLFLKVYRFINNVSLDIATGTVIGALFFCRIMHVTPPIAVIVTLCLSVLIIYTIDHLLDARKIKQSASTERHRFHQRNFFILSLLLLLTLVANVIIIFYLPAAVFNAGLFLGCLVILYFLIQHRLYFMKEVVGAFFYTAGVILPALALTGLAMDKFKFLLIVQFMCTALINLLVFSYFDHTSDEKDSHSSLTTSLGEGFTKVLIGFLFFVCTIISIYQVLTLFDWAVIVILSMDLALLTILIFHNYFSVGERFRFLGDAVFLVPLIYLLIE